MPPFDMRRWLHMALFYKAESGEASEGRPPFVVATFKAAAAMALQHDDEVWGCLCAWNAAAAIKSGGRPYLLGELLTWLDHAYDCRHKLASWHGHLLIASRLDVLKSMKGDIKVGGGNKGQQSTSTPELVFGFLENALVAAARHQDHRLAWPWPRPGPPCCRTMTLLAC